MDKNLSHQNWFRLRKSESENSLGHSISRSSENPDKIEHKKGAAASNPKLTPVALPPNHDGMDMSQLPPLREAILDEGQIDQLFSDIGMLATDILLMQKQKAPAKKAAAGRAEDQRRLELAKDALLNGNVARVQIRYKWKQLLWIDTLTSLERGFKLVRILHRQMPGS